MRCFPDSIAASRAGSAKAERDSRPANSPPRSRRSSAPILREEDTRGDGTPDRWIAYRGTARHEVFEDRRARGRPDLRLVFAEAGDPLELIEVDRAGDGTPDHMLRYADGALSADSSDTDGDGHCDRFDRFDAAGRVDVREEDLNGDGQVDVRSEVRRG